MSRKGMLSREEADRAAVTGQVARRRMPGVLPTAAKRLYNEARLAGYEVATTRLGATIEVRVTRGWSVVSVMSTVAVAVPPDAMDCSMTARAFSLAASISDLKVPVVPSSATASIPALAVPPLLQKVTLPLCTAPIKVVKCSPDGTATPLASAPSTASNPTAMRRDPANTEWAR